MSRSNMILLLFFPFLCIPLLFAQELHHSHSLNHLNPGETIAHIAAGTKGYAIETVLNQADGKAYYIRSDSKSFGPFDEVKDLQWSFNDSVLIFAARIDTEWTVYEGSDRSYGPWPFKSYSKLPIRVFSGKEPNGLLFEFVSTIHSRDKYFTGADGLVSEAPYLSFYKNLNMSADGENLVYTRWLFSNNLYKNASKIPFLKNFGSIRTVKFYKDYVGIFYEHANSGQYKFKDYEITPFGGVIYCYLELIHQEFTTQLHDLRTPGDLVFSEPYLNNIDYYYSGEDSSGIWRLYKNNLDMKVDQKEMKAFCVMPGGELMYAARPCEPAPQGFDPELFYIYVKGQPLSASAYLDVQQIVRSSRGTSFAAVVKTQDGWNIALQEGGIGPFAEIGDVAYFGENVLGFDAFYQGEWRDFILTPGGIQQGTLIRKNGNLIGLAHLNDSQLDIYLEK